MQKWEYIRVKIGGAVGTRDYPGGHEDVWIGGEILLDWNEFGRTGWELVSTGTDKVWERETDQQHDQTFGYFKREFQDENLGDLTQIDRDTYDRKRNKITKEDEQ